MKLPEGLEFRLLSVATSPPFLYSANSVAKSRELSPQRPDGACPRFACSSDDEACPDGVVCGRQICHPRLHRPRNLHASPSRDHPAVNSKTGK